jgi:hypothetical protein
MVWLYRSPIPVERRGVIPSFNIFLPAFVMRRGWGGGVGTLCLRAITATPVILLIKLEATTIITWIEINPCLCIVPSLLLAPEACTPSPSFPRQQHSLNAYLPKLSLSLSSVCVASNGLPISVDRRVGVNQKKVDVKTSSVMAASQLELIPPPPPLQLTH